jgi:hypothetical protein
MGQHLDRERKRPTHDRNTCVVLYILNIHCFHKSKVRFTRCCGERRIWDSPQLDRVKPSRGASTAGERSHWVLDASPIAYGHACRKFFRSERHVQNSYERRARKRVMCSAEQVLALSEASPGATGAGAEPS